MSDIPSPDKEQVPAVPGGRLRHAPWACLVLLLALHFALMMSRYAPAIATPDANGYWAQGSLLFSEGRTWFRPECDLQYVNMHWLVTPSGKHFSRYPPGLAVVVGAAWRVFGYKAGVLVNPLLATLSLLGLFLLARRLLSPWWSLAAAFTLAVNPVFNQQAIWCFAHMAVLAPLVWGLFFLLRWSDAGRLADAFVAGLLLGCIPTVRYPEALFALGIGVFLLMHRGSRRRLWLHCLVAAAGALIPVVPLLVRNHLAFGAFYRTGYALTNEQTGFGWDYFRQHFINYVRGMHGEGAGPFLLLGLAGMALMCCLRERRRPGVLLALLSVPTVLLYMAYYWGGQRGPGGMRFLLPVFALFSLAGTWLLAHLGERTGTAVRYSMVGTALGLQLLWGAFHAEDEAARLLHEKRVLVAATDALEKHVRPGEVILAGRQMLQHLDYVRRWKLADLSNLGPERGARFLSREADTDAPSPRQAEQVRQRLEKYADFSADEREVLMAAGLSTWSGGRKVYFVGTEENLGALAGPVFNSASFKITARVPLPEPPPVSFRGRAGMPGMGGRPGGGGQRRFPGRGGFMGRPGGFSDAKELVIAELLWTAAPGPARPEPAESGTALADKVAERVRNLRALVRRMRDSGQVPDFFWPPRRERELRELLDARRFAEADALLDEALRDYKRGPGPPMRR